MPTDLKTAINLCQRGRRREALKLLRELASAHPNDATICFEYAQTLDNLSREREAIPQYHRALRLNPDHPAKYEIMLYLASSYRKTGRPAAAGRWLRKAERLGQTSGLQSKLRRLLDRTGR